MKPGSGELSSNEVIVSNPKDIGRLFQKSKFGQTRSNNSLYITLIESVFLIEEQKLNVYLGNKKIHFDEMVSYATKLDPSFEEKFVVFRDLRKRGIQVQTSNDPLFTFYCEKKDDETLEKLTYFIKVISEREVPSIFNLKKLIQHATETKGLLRLAIVDEEGDITYYEIEMVTPQGINQNHSYNPIKGILLSNRVVIFDELTCDRLYKKEFFGKPFGDGLQLSLVEAFYLIKKEILQCVLPSNENVLSTSSFAYHIAKYQQDIFLRYPVFSDLRSKGLIVKTGFKFGTHFRAYQKSPFKSHAEYLIHTIDETYETQWSEISRAVRLAHAVNKFLLFALIEHEKSVPTYLNIARIRP